MKREVRGIFVTGTDTGVGKTYIAAGITKELAARGVNVGVMKPAETGCTRREGLLRPRDAIRLLTAARSRDSLGLVNPYRFAKPLAPAMAARLDGPPIEPKKILTAFRTLSARHDVMIVEGAGGILVPLVNRYCYLDLAEEIGLPVLIVARPGLGTVNHSLLTIEALTRRKLTVAGIVLNDVEDRKAGIAERTNPEIIRELSGVRIAGIVRHGCQEWTGLVNSLFSPPRRAGREGRN